MTVLLFALLSAVARGASYDGRLLLSLLCSRSPFSGNLVPACLFSHYGNKYGQTGDIISNGMALTGGDRLPVASYWAGRRCCQFARCEHGGTLACLWCMSGWASYLWVVLGVANSGEG